FCYDLVDAAVSFFFSSRRRHTRSKRDWSSDVCSSDLSAPCLLSAICGPIILQGGSLAALPSNPYLYATLFSVACAYFIPNMLLSVVASLAGFYVLMAVW